MLAGSLGYGFMASHLYIGHTNSFFCDISIRYFLSCQIHSVSPVDSQAYALPPSTMTSSLPVNGHTSLKPLNPAVQQRLIDDGHWER